MITTALDVLALLLVAAGIALGLWSLIGGLSLIPAGFVVAVGSAASRGPGA